MTFLKMGAIHQNKNKKLGTICQLYIGGFSGEEAMQRLLACKGKDPYR